MRKKRKTILLKTDSIMGTTYTDCTRSQLIESILKPWNREMKDGAIVLSVRCRSHCYRGNAYSGVLWSVWERIYIDAKTGEDAFPQERFIACDILKYDNTGGNGMWGHKPLDESMGPFYYSCPLGYLRDCPIDEFGGNAEWRKSVFFYHREKKKAREEKKEAKRFLSIPELFLSKYRSKDGKGFVVFYCDGRTGSEPLNPGETWEGPINRIRESLIRQGVKEYTERVGDGNYKCPCKNAE